MPEHGTNPVGEHIILHRMGEQDKLLTKIVKLLDGNGDPSNGMVVRLDRIESHVRQAHEQKLPKRVAKLESQVGLARWMSATSVTAVIGTVVTWIGSKLTGHQ